MSAPYRPMQDPLFDPAGLATAYKETMPQPPNVLASSVIAKVTIPGTPMSKQRPRFVRKTGAVFTPKETRDREHQIGQYVWARGWRRPADPESAFGVRAIFYVPDQQRKDTDNMLKLVLDGLNGVVWADDCQVCEVMGWKKEDASNPRTELVVYTLGFPAKTMAECEQCHKRYRRYPSWKHRQYCSRKCSSLAAQTGVDLKCANCNADIYRQRAEVAKNRRGEFFCSQRCRRLGAIVSMACAQCGTAFTRARSLLRSTRLNYFCSRECDGLHRNKERRSVRRGDCEVCGGPVSRPEYPRCIVHRRPNVRLAKQPLAAGRSDAAEEHVEGGSPATTSGEEKGSDK